MVCWFDLMSLHFKRLPLIAFSRCLCLKPHLFKMYAIRPFLKSPSLSLNRGPVQRHDVRLRLHGAVRLPGPRDQRAAGGRGPGREGRLRGPRLDRRGPRFGPQGEPDQPGQALPGGAGAALVRARPGPGPGPLQGDEPPPGQQDPPPEVPLLSRPQRTVTHTRRQRHTLPHMYTHNRLKGEVEETEELRRRSGWLEKRRRLTGVKWKGRGDG